MQWRIENGDEPRQQKRAKKHDAARPSACHGRGRRDVDSSRPRGFTFMTADPCVLALAAATSAKRLLSTTHACPRVLSSNLSRHLTVVAAKEAELSTKARRRALSTRLSKRHGAATQFRVRPGAVGDATTASQCHAFRALAHAGASHFQHTSGNDCIRPARGGWGCR